MSRQSMGQTLKEARKGSGLSMSEILKKLAEKGKKISDKTIYNYESGYRQPDADTLMLLCDIYSIHDVLEEFGYKTTALTEGPELSSDEYAFILNYRALPAHEQSALFDIVARAADVNALRRSEESRREREEEIARQYIIENFGSPEDSREAAGE